MTAEDLVVDDGGDGQTVEAIRERLPQTDAEPFFAFFVKSVDSEKRKGARKCKEAREILT